MLQGRFLSLFAVGALNLKKLNQHYADVFVCYLIIFFIVSG